MRQFESFIGRRWMDERVGINAPYFAGVYKIDRSFRFFDGTKPHQTQFVLFFSGSTLSV
jgi:hypothetical protein